MAAFHRLGPKPSFPYGQIPSRRLCAIAAVTHTTDRRKPTFVQVVSLRRLLLDMPGTNPRLSKLRPPVGRTGGRPILRNVNTRTEVGCNNVGQSHRRWRSTMKTVLATALLAGAVMAGTIAATSASAQSEPSAAQLAHQLDQNGVASTYVYRGGVRVG